MRDAQAASRRLPGAPAVLVELVFTDFPAQRIAVDAQNLRCLGLIAFGAIENTLDEALFKFLDGFVKKNAFLDHLRDKPFQLVFHSGTLRIP
jgi:hypothetical protein